jgi:DNA-binding MurR/RpiR family transcriptional regulator
MKSVRRTRAGFRAAGDGRAEAEPPDVLATIAAAFDGLTLESRKAARYISGNRSEVAFRSMRSVARAAGVSPPTMVRLAKTLGYSGYEALRRAFQQRIEGRPASLLARAQIVSGGAGSRRTEGIRQLIDGELANMRACVAGLSEVDLARVERLFAQARRVYVLGLRGMYPAAFFFHYTARTFSDKTFLVEGGGATHLDTVRGIARNDAVLVFTCKPYPRDTLQALRYAHRRGAKVVAVTDSGVSPAARLATVAFEVRPNPATLLSSAAANMLMSQVLAAVFMSASGRAGVAALKAADTQVAEFQIYDADERRR